MKHCMLYLLRSLTCGNLETCCREKARSVNLEDVARELVAGLQLLLYRDLQTCAHFPNKSILKPRRDKKAQTFHKDKTRSRWLRKFTTTYYSWLVGRFNSAAKVSAAVPFAAVARLLIH